MAIKEKIKKGGKVTLDVSKRFKKTVISVVFIVAITILALTGVIEPSQIMNFLKLMFQQ